MSRLISIIFLFAFLFSPAFALAEITPPPPDNQTVRLVNPIGGTEESPQGTVDMRMVLGRAIQITLGFLGSLTLAVFFYGGYLWLTSAGNSEKVQQGTRTLTYAVIGLFIIFGAYGILNTIISGIRSQAGNTNWNIEENETPFGPENGPMVDCSTLTQNACANAADCAWITFIMPGTSDTFQECVRKNQKQSRCEDLFQTCVSRGPGPARGNAGARLDQHAVQCDNQRQACAQ